MLKRLLRRPAAQALFARALGRYLAFALATTRWTLDGSAHLAPHLGAPHLGAPHLGNDPAIVAFWHERLPLMPALWTLARRRAPDVAATRVLVSRHADGRFIGAVLGAFDLQPVFGSSSRGGAAGLRALLDTLAAGLHVAITPDGPRGPRRVAAPGVASLAALSGRKILPCGAAISRCRTLRSWDRMVLPLPWGRGVVVCGPGITVARGEAEAALPAIAAALTAAADRADRLLG